MLTFLRALTKMLENRGISWEPVIYDEVAASPEESSLTNDEQIIPCTSAFDCGGRCPPHALDVGIIDELKTKYGDVTEAYSFEYSRIVQPYVTTKPKQR